MPDVRDVTNFPPLKSCTPSCKCAFNRVLSQDNTHPTPTLCLLVALKRLASARIPCLLFSVNIFETFDPCGAPLLGASLLIQRLFLETGFTLPWAHQGSGSSPRPVCVGWPNLSRTLPSSRTHSPLEPIPRQPCPIVNIFETFDPCGAPLLGASLLIQRLFLETGFTLPWAHQGSGSSPRPVCVGWPNLSRTLPSSRTHSPLEPIPRQPCPMLGM
ncbi:hypothetical protein LWI28_005613 [Acer negundo]|uniref:Uncharacterized protein n=1 Tax=Acer negundo TaxID=4023 RepID=A0AAD5NTU2_ACENE|nr:hypothetical protein LWI28_005613 [Acer negundo]